MPDRIPSVPVGELKVHAHVITLGTGIYCIFLAKDQEFSFSKNLPAIKISGVPGGPDIQGNVSFSAFDKEGWLSEDSPAVLIKVKKGPAQILVSFYDDVHSEMPLPRLQILQVGGVSESETHIVENKNYKNQDLKEGHLLAHIQEKGDVMSPLSQWIGEAGSDLWIEGFKISVPPYLQPEDLEYQAVLGKGWLSPWVEGEEFCGSRGMSLPLLGLKVRLKGAAAEKWRVQVEAVFMDGFRMDNHQDDEKPLESPEHSPLESFRISFFEKKQKRKISKSASSGKKTGKKE